jgi:hypothetical protein
MKQCIYLLLENLINWEHIDVLPSFYTPVNISDQETGLRRFLGSDGFVNLEITLAFDSFLLLSTYLPCTALIWQINTTIIC